MKMNKEELGTLFTEALKPKLIGKDGILDVKVILDKECKNYGGYWVCYSDIIKIKVLMLNPKTGKPQKKWRSYI